MALWALLLYIIINTNTNTFLLAKWPSKSTFSQVWGLLMPSGGFSATQPIDQLEGLQGRTELFYDRTGSLRNGV